MVKGSTNCHGPLPIGTGVVTGPPVHGTPTDFIGEPRTDRLPGASNRRRRERDEYEPERIDPIAAIGTGWTGHLEQATLERRILGNRDTTDAYISPFCVGSRMVSKSIPSRRTVGGFGWCTNVSVLQWPSSLARTLAPRGQPFGNGGHF